MQFQSIWRNPKFYGLLGFISVVGPSLLFFFAGRPYKFYYPATGATGIIWQGALQPFFLYFVIGAAIAAWGCYRNTLLAWLGSISVLALSILIFTGLGLIIVPGAVLLLVGAALKTFSKGT